MSLLRRIAFARLDGAKVSIRPVDREDAETAFVLLHGERDILRWLLWRGPESTPELERSFAHWTDASAPYPDYMFAIVDRESGSFCGTSGLRFGGQVGGADLGYWLAKPLWGHGLGTEAIRLTCDFAFRHLGAPSLSAWAFVGNEGSRKVLERNGFSLMRTVLQKTESDGQAYDQWHFVLLREEWIELNCDWRPRAERIEYVD